MGGNLIRKGLTNLPLACKGTRYIIFNCYDIPFKILKSGPNKGNLAVLPIRDRDHIQIIEAERALRREGFDWAIDHRNVFRDDSGGLIVTFSPYAAWQQIMEIDGIRLGNIEVTVSDYSIYGMMTQTIVCREY